MPLVSVHDETDTNLYNTPRQFPPLIVVVESNHQHTPPASAYSVPDDVEAELYQHAMWLCENGHPVSWESIEAIGCRLGKIAGVQGEDRRDGGGGGGGCLPACLIACLRTSFDTLPWVSRA